MIAVSSSSGDYENVIEPGFKETQNVSYSIVERRQKSGSPNGSAITPTKPSKYTKMEKGLLVITTVQSVLLIIAIACMALTYSRSTNIEERLKNLPRIEAPEKNLSFHENSFRHLEIEIGTILQELKVDTNLVLINMSQQISSLKKTQKVLTSNLNILKNETYEYHVSINSTTSTINNATRLLLDQVSKECEAHITNVRANTESQLNNFALKLIEDLTALHSFDSCEELRNLSSLFPAGIYKVKSSNCSFTLKYCSTGIALSCGGVPGQWRRIAYLNTEEKKTVLCPEGFEVRNNTVNPPLCRRMNTSAGCSSVIYPSNGMSYSRVCGRVRVHPAGSPDGFISYNTEIMRNNRSVNQNYVDGVSLTYGNRPNSTHIWTYVFVTKSGTDTDRCLLCEDNKPFYVGNNYTCVAEYCANYVRCYPQWGDDIQQCLGNETFYTQLNDLTTMDNDIEMRVCREQDQVDEDILFSFVELFVL